jgi:hypothetical protein
MKLRNSCGRPALLVSVSRSTAMLFAQAGVRVFGVDFNGGAAERMATEPHSGEA